MEISVGEEHNMREDGPAVLTTAKKSCFGVFDRRIILNIKFGWSFLRNQISCNFVDISEL